MTEYINYEGVKYKIVKFQPYSPTGKAKPRMMLVGPKLELKKGVVTHTSWSDNATERQTRGIAAVRRKLPPTDIESIKARMLPEKVELEKYIYILGFDYDKKTRRGHQYHAEIRIESSRTLTENELFELAANKYNDHPIFACDMKVRGVEKEKADREVETTVEMVEYGHKVPIQRRLA